MTTATQNDNVAIMNPYVELYRGYHITIQNGWYVINDGACNRNWISGDLLNPPAACRKWIDADIWME